MTGTEEPQEAEERLDVLRRRLYRADATEDDRLRYADRRAELAGPEAAPAPTALPPRPRGGLIAAGAVAAVLLAAGTGVALEAPRSAPQPRSSTAARSAEAAVVQDVGDGQLLTESQRPVSGPTRVATSVDGTAVVGQRFTGTGAAVVQLDISAASFRGGRVLVSMVPLGSSSPVAWRALHLTTRNDWSSSVQVVARSPIAARGGAVSPPTVFAYRAGPPSRIAVEAPTAVRWALVVAYTSRAAPVLR